MTAPARSLQLGHHVFGVAAVASGLVTLVWHDHNLVLAYAGAAALILGGISIQFPRTAKCGAIALGAAYLVFALLLVPPIVATPLVFDPWGNFFEQFTLVVGAALVYGWSSAWSPETLKRIGRFLLGICVVSFAVYQAVHLDFTSSLVPKWLPPSQMFWTIATTVAFALAAVALLINRMALLAAGLLTVMLVIFGLLVWVPLLLANPHSHTNWSEIILTFAIAGVAWTLADVLGEPG